VEKTASILQNGGVGGGGGMDLEIRAWALRGCESDLESKPMPLHPKSPQGNLTKGEGSVSTCLCGPTWLLSLGKSHYHGSSPWAKKMAV
jgi:hypothetical protein